MMDGLPEHIQHALYDKIKELVALHELDYADNFRYALVGDIQGEADYDAMREQGCCGFFDTEITLLGKRYLVGCNYGH